MSGEEIFHMFQNLDKNIIYPSSGLSLFFLQQNTQLSLKNIMIYDGFEEKILNPKKIYKVCTNDFLANGGDAMNEVRVWYKELRNKKDFGNIRDLIIKYMSKMKGIISEDKFVDKKYPKYIIGHFK